MRYGSGEWGRGGWRLEVARWAFEVDDSTDIERRWTFDTRDGRDHDCVL